jgi:sodium/potassium/calcium exchanger 6
MPNAESRTSTFPISTGSIGSHLRIPGLYDQAEHPRPVKGWPYTFLPPPHVLLGTLFPTLQGWKDKTFWDRFASIISVPSVFLLVITLPVVEAETQDDGSEDNVLARLASGEIGDTATSAAPTGSNREWQEYQRATRSMTSRSVVTPAPARITVESPSRNEQAAPGAALPSQEQANPAPALAPDTATTASEYSAGWNRWLVVLQIFTGPLFSVFIFWANWEADMRDSGRSLLRLVLCSLLTSLVLLGAMLMTTTPEKRPKYHFLLCFLGFVISVAWISTLAGEVVGVLKAYGVILGISEAILGLTVFAIGNSLGDLVADVTMARLGYPVMALYVQFDRIRRDTWN